MLNSVLTLLLPKQLGDSRGTVKNEILVGFDPYEFFLVCLSFLRSCFRFFFFQTDLIDNSFTKRQKINKREKIRSCTANSFWFNLWVEE